MYAPGDGPRPVTKWVSFDDIGEVKDMIIDQRPLKRTVNGNELFPSSINYPIGKNIFEIYKRDKFNDKPNVYRYKTEKELSKFDSDNDDDFTENEQSSSFKNSLMFDESNSNLKKSVYRYKMV